MIAVDANILVYAHRFESPFNQQAFDCIQALATHRRPWAIPLPCLHEFYSIATHPKRYIPASTPAQACSQLDAWMGSGSLQLIGETQSHWATLKPMLLGGLIVDGMVHDARIAAICLQHGVREFWTADRDFSRFPKLKCRNPLIS
jgi:predicted nucleic acid-binding protein